jgi:hypothetical protein
MIAMKLHSPTPAAPFRSGALASVLQSVTARSAARTVAAGLVESVRRARSASTHSVSGIASLIVTGNRVGTMAVVGNVNVRSGWFAILGSVSTHAFRNAQTWSAATTAARGCVASVLRE